MKKITRKIDDESLNLIGIIYGQAPVQAEGTINGFSFYFRAKYEEWTFAISEYSSMDPADIQTIEAGKKYGFLKEAIYQSEGKYSASYMLHEIAEKFIIDCCIEYKKKNEI